MNKRTGFTLVIMGALITMIGCGTGTNMPTGPSDARFRVADSTGVLPLITAPNFDFKCERAKGAYRAQLRVVERIQEQIRACNGDLNCFLDLWDTFVEAVGKLKDLGDDVKAACGDDPDIPL